MLFNNNYSNLSLLSIIKARLKSKLFHCLAHTNYKIIDYKQLIINTTDDFNSFSQYFWAKITILCYSTSIKDALSTVNRFLNEYTINIAKKAQTVSAINNDQITPVKPNKLFKTNRTGIITVPCALP